MRHPMDIIMDMMKIKLQEKKRLDKMEQKKGKQRHEPRNDQKQKENGSKYMLLETYMCIKHFPLAPPLDSPD